jgi:hypothetical protein
MDRILIALACTLMLPGCAAYTVASAGAYLATDRTLTDHLATVSTGYDCSTGQPFKGEYYCEKKPVYNQNPF